LGKKIVNRRGPAGLGAAYRLAELGHEDWEVFERDDHVAGLASVHRRARLYLGPWRTSCSAITATSMIVEKMLKGDYDQHMREAGYGCSIATLPCPFQNNIHRRLRRYSASACGIEPEEQFDPRQLSVDQFGFPVPASLVFMMPYNFKVWPIRSR
jgi:UDP-galactopyranose mutase